MKDEMMDFLLTYGWAILVVIAAIAALAYFNVFDNINNSNEGCPATTCNTDTDCSEGYFCCSQGCGPVEGSFKACEPIEYRAEDGSCTIIN